jgi:hypothetical protein
MKFYTWNSSQVLALTLSQTGAATFSTSVGIGNNPNTFNGTTARSLQVGTSWVGTFAASSTFGTILGNNVYFFSDWRRTLAQPVSFIQFNEDNFYFSNAATGAADSTFSPILRMSITSDGYTRLSANSGGIQFNGDTAAANALDDYEEGAWTPVVKIGATTNTASVTRARYTKIGNVVYIQATIESITKSGSGGLTIEGLPFNVGAASNFVNDFFDGLKSNVTNSALQKAKQNKLPKDIVDIMAKIQDDSDKLRDQIKKYSKYTK